MEFFYILLFCIGCLTVVNLIITSDNEFDISTLNRDVKKLKKEVKNLRKYLK